MTTISCLLPGKQPRYTFIHEGYIKIVHIPFLRGGNYKNVETFWMLLMCFCLCTFYVSLDIVMFQQFYFKAFQQIRLKEESATIQAIQQYIMCFIDFQSGRSLKSTCCRVPPTVTLNSLQVQILYCVFDVEASSLLSVCMFCVCGCVLPLIARICKHNLSKCFS